MGRGGARVRVYVCFNCVNFLHASQSVRGFCAGYGVSGHVASFSWCVVCADDMI